MLNIAWIAIRLMYRCPDKHTDNIGNLSRKRPHDTSFYQNEKCTGQEICETDLNPFPTNTTTADDFENIYVQYGSFLKVNL